MTAKKGLNKAQIEKLLVAERQKMREKAKASEFMRRTLSIYNGQVKRAKDLGKKVEYSLDDLRCEAKLRLALGTCEYCQAGLTEKNFTCDHRVSVAQGGPFTMPNTAFICKPCNWQKGGVMDQHEFRALQDYLNGLRPEVARDIRMRLSTGGKFHPGK